MSNLHLAPQVSSKVNNAIVISGCGRSGTTILGKIIHSMQGVEYILEPPMLACLMSTISEIDEQSWKLLYESYLYEEFLLNAIAGRTINCNRKDDSSIYNCKSEQEIEQRLHNSLSKVETQKLAVDAHISWKWPNAVPSLPMVKEYYPGSRIIICTRGAVDVFHSILSYGWLSDDSIQKKNQFWPVRHVDSTQIPYFIDPKYDDNWADADILQRIAYYYISMMEPIEHITDCIVFNYHQFADKPHETIQALADQLELSGGAKTQELLDGVKPRTYDDRDTDILDVLKAEEKEQVINLSKTYAGGI